MSILTRQISKYLEYCQYQKRLDEKTLKAYRIDLRQFSEQLPSTDIPDISQAILEDYLICLHKNYKPKTVKRKIASIKAFFHYLEYREVIEKNPFDKIQIKFREPVILPKTIPLHTVEVFLQTIYTQHDNAKTLYQKKNALRDAAVTELLFSTGIRISELCSLGMNDVNLYDGTILIYGKGDKERRLQIVICITKISTFLILCDLAVCLATLYVSFSLVFALMRYLQGKVFLIRFYSPTTLSSSRAEFRLPSRLACA